MKTPKQKHIHFVGIKGVAMTALALYLHDQHVQVTGSDIAGVFPTDETLKKAGIPVVLGFAPETIRGIPHCDLVIYTGAHNGCENVEVIEAVKCGIPVMPHGKALGMFMDGYTQISVAGSHGKTTTSAMLANIFSKAGKQPSYCVGCGDIKGLGYPGHAGHGDIFIAEADEYVTDPGHDATPRFLWQKPDILTVTNIDFDHPDVYENLAGVQDAFLKLQHQLTGRKLTVVNNDDVQSRVLLDNNRETVTYGFSIGSDYRITCVDFRDGETTFTVSVRNMEMGNFALHIPGRHNVSNAASAIVTAHVYGLSYEQIRSGVASFQGAKRRLEVILKLDACMVIDDYAHHPREIAASLDALRSWYPHRRIITVFQPHTYSRTKELLKDFAGSFMKSDMVCIADIYASAREKDTLGITSADLVEEIALHKKPVYYIKNFSGLLKFIDRSDERGDIYVLMGAGDIYEWSAKLKHHFMKSI